MDVPTVANITSACTHVRHFLDDFSFACNISELPALLRQLQLLSPDELAQREAAVKRVASTHFTYRGVMAQIGQFMLGDTTDLRCEPLPSSPRDA
jgi:hypothetical protein